MKRVAGWIAVGLMGIGVGVLACEEREPSYSTPTNTVKAFYAAVWGGSREDVRACFVVPETKEEEELLDYGFSESIYYMEARAAMAKVFPDAMKGDALLGKVMQALANEMVEKIEGNRATLEGPDETMRARSVAKQKPILLKKVGSEWKMVIKEGAFLGKRTPEEIERIKVLKAEVGAYVARVKAKKYWNIAEAREGWNAVLAGLERERIVTSGPASQKGE